ncbi:hypothetical protein QFZ30_000241 [Arthrobacter pascens]|nr:hypothetical protein [Arthrobacter pascens]
MMCSTQTTEWPDGRTSLRTNDGKYAFWGLTPTPYPIPHDGPVGRMLEATGRSPVRASHLHFMVTATGLRTLVTHIFVEGDPQIDIGDSVFGVKESLIKRFEPQSPGTPTPDGRNLSSRGWARTRFDIVLAPAKIWNALVKRGSDRMSAAGPARAYDPAGALVLRILEKAWLTALEVLRVPETV